MVNSTEGTNEFRKTRSETIAVWNELTEASRMDLSELYFRQIEMPERHHSSLTGREIEIILQTT